MSNKVTDTSLLRQFITAAYPLKEDELEKFLTGWQPFECKRKTILTAAGETERYLYFVLEGIQRGFYIGKRQPGSNSGVYLSSFFFRAGRFISYPNAIQIFYGDVDHQ